MLSKVTEEKIKGILIRLASGGEVSLHERSFLQKQADNDQLIERWLHTSIRQQRQEPQDGIDSLLDDLAIGSIDPEDRNHKQVDLGEWFSGVPSWVSRS